MLTFTKPAVIDRTLLWRRPRTRLFGFPLASEALCGDCRHFGRRGVPKAVAGRCGDQIRPGIIGQSVPACFKFQRGEE